jgi:predicted phage gp36 major capsid-like protein
MKPSVLILSVALAAAAGAGAYVTLVLLPKERALLAEQNAMLAEQRKTLDQQRAQLEREVSVLEQVQASAASQVKATEAASENLLQTQEAVNEQQRIGRAAADALAVGSSARVSIAEYLATNGKPCNSNSECGLPAPEGFASEAVLRLNIEAGGKIVMDLADQFGVEQPKLVMIPELLEGEFAISKWQCQTNIPITGTVLGSCSKL